MTKDKASRYLVNPTLCPHCRSANISGEVPDVDDFSNITRTVVCNACDTWWTEVFTMIDVHI